MSVVLSGGSAVVRSSPQYVALREVVTDVARQVEDQHWHNLSTDARQVGYDDSHEDRVRSILRYRSYRRRDPLAKQGATLLVSYVLGQGITLRANNKALVGRIVDEFWEDPVNRRAFTGQQALADFVTGVWTDGDFFLVMLPDETNGTVSLATIDAPRVEDVITDPNNWRVPLWYKVRVPRVSYDFSGGTYRTDDSGRFMYYRDWRNDQDVGPGTPRAKQIAEGLVYHVRRGGGGKFGDSELMAAVDWVKAHKEFMEDRATLSRAAAQIAWRKKRTGSPTDVASQVAAIQSSLVTQAVANYERNPPSASASTIVENQGSTMEWVKTDTGGPSALADERILRMMAGSGMGGVANHYFGDEASANLATATAMELPMMKYYEGWQKFLSDAVGDVLTFVLEVAERAGRIGPRDDASRYSDLATTGEDVLTQNAASPGSVPRLLPAVAGVPGTSPARPAEADMAPVVPPGTAGGQAIQARDPNLVVSLIPKAEPSSITADTEDKTGPVDWYVDVDFPPIVQKKLDDYVTAIKALYDLMPVENIESQRLAVSMLLNALGVNDVHQELDRLFAGVLEARAAKAQDASLVDDATAAARYAQAKAQVAGLAGQGGPPPEPGATTSESFARLDWSRRFVRSVREGTDALSVVGA